MGYQKNIFGERDGKVDRVLSHVTSRGYEGATPTETAKTLRHRIGKVRECLNLLVARREVRVCGERVATLRSKRVEPVYKATQFLTQPAPESGPKKLTSTKHVKIVEVSCEIAYRSKCPACNADVMIQPTEHGDALCDPQKRYVIFDSDSGELTGFEDNIGKLVSGRPAIRDEAMSLHRFKRCGESWAVIRCSHFSTCTASRKEWDAVWQREQEKAAIDWTEVAEAAAAAMGCQTPSSS